MMAEHCARAFQPEMMLTRLSSSRRCQRPTAWIGCAAVFAGLLQMLTVGPAAAQVNVVTAHNDIARTGQNLNETALTPQNVNPGQFGKLFTQQIVGHLRTQPLYVSQVAIPGQGIHNVVYVTSSSDLVYAFDADTNGGANAGPLWKTSLLNNTTPIGQLSALSGILGTPVIDVASQAMYLVNQEIQGTTYAFFLHALDITTGAEKLGGPVQIQASISGTGSGSSGGILTFNAQSQIQRPGLLLLNGILYVAFGSQNDLGAWHGWLFSYKAATLQPISVFCTSGNGSAGGIWEGGSGLAAEVADQAKPYGRMFIATGNGSYSASYPYTQTMSYGMSVLDLDLSGGVMTVQDEFTPSGYLPLDKQDGGLGSSGPVLLPPQTVAGQTLNPLVQISKSGAIYLLDRGHLGGFSTSGDQVIQEVQTPIPPGYSWGAGVWGSAAYWNNHIYFSGTNPTPNSYTASGNSLTAYSLTNGVLSSTPTSQSVETFSFPGPTPSVSANGANDGIVWVVKADVFPSYGFETLLAYDANNLANTLYSSNINLARDSPGTYVAFVVPTIANGKVYVGASGSLSVYGLLNSTPTAPAPIISPAGGPFAGTQTVAIGDALPGVTIYYTTDGSAPNSSSPVYQNPLNISSNQTIAAVASATGYVQSYVSSATFEANTTSNPTFSLPGGSYSGAQMLTIADSSTGAKIYYTVDGSAPTTISAAYQAALSVSSSETVRAIAVALGLSASPSVVATYLIQQPPAVDFSTGFTLAQGPMKFNGVTTLNGSRLELTDGGIHEASSAFFATPLNIQTFATDFSFQLSNPVSSGITFTIQNGGPGAIGVNGQGLGYAGIPTSLAIKFDINDNAGEGTNSTGLYLNGANPTVPAINLNGTGIKLRSGDIIAAHLAYDGTTLKMTLTDTITLASWSNSFPVNIPSIVGANTALVGFTGSTGATTSTQQIISWTYQGSSASPSLPSYASGFQSGHLTLNGGAILSGTRLRLTDNHNQESRSAFFSDPVNIQGFATSFDFQLTNANRDGFTFTIEGVGPTALGSPGGGLGYGTDPSILGTVHIGQSVAIKFDLYNSSKQGPDSTGLYINGVQPTVPSIDLSTTGIDLHSGDTFNAALTYKGGVLTVAITDKVTNAAATQTYTVNIPSIVGGPTAFVGFTGSTGGQTAIQEILNWSYSVLGGS